MPRPGPRPQPQPIVIGDAFTVEYHHVTIDIDGQHAITKIDQVFRNVSGGLAQAQFMFPVPHGANIANFSLWIGVKEMAGEMLDADKARTVIVIKRSLSPGFAGIPNPLFANDNTMMFFSDAKKAFVELIEAVKQS